MYDGPFQKGCAAEGVGQDPAGDAPLPRANERRDHVVRAPTFVPDVERETAALPGIVDVGDQAVEDLLHLGEEPDVVSRQRRRPEDPLGMTTERLAEGRVGGR
jgi:hypothetical protein